MPDTPPTVPPRPGILPRLIGLFALGQLVFFPLVNLMEFVPLRPTPYDLDPPIETTQRWGRFTDIEPIQRAAEVVQTILGFWSEVTGQDQGWDMFTPAFPPYTVVSVVELRFPDGTTDRVVSPFSRPGFRAPLLHDREFNFEANIVMLGWDCSPEALADRPDLARLLPERARANDVLLIRWLGWHAERYQRAHPGKPAPVEVVQVLRFIPIQRPAEPAFERPFARLLSAAPADPELLPLEGYDPLTRRYVPLKRWERP